MRKIVSLLLICVLVLCSVQIASADKNGTIVDYLADYENLKLYAAIRQQYRTTLSVTASIDKSDPVEIRAEAIQPDQIGHIIVIDTSYPYCNTKNQKWLTAENSYVPILQKYLGIIGNNELVKFILSRSGSAITETEWMPNNQAQNYVRSEVTLEGKNGATGVGVAINTAFKEVATYEPGTPMFKDVFAILDADNSNNGEKMKNGSGTFPFFLVTMTQSGGKIVEKKTRGVSNSLSAYQSFVSANNGVYIQLDHSDKKEIDCSSLSEQVSPSLNSIQYYVLDLSPVHPMVNYEEKSHQLYINVFSSDGSQQPNILTLDTELLPTPVPTEIPTPEQPTPEPEPTDSPAPTPVVARDASDSNALKAIMRLWELFYLNEKTTNFNEECRYAFLEFCRNNGLPANDEIDSEAFYLLMNGDPVAKATATPSPTVAMTTVPPTNSPEPKVYIGSVSTTGILAIKQLQKLYYLDPDATYNSFDSNCMSAFLDFCSDNGMHYDKDYIDDDFYDFLMRTTKPRETPTPEPTVPQEGYVIGDTESENSSFITQMQGILSDLDLFRDAYTPGSVDQPTLDAAALYCEVYELLNTSESNTISQQIVNDILTKGPERKPYATPIPGLSEKAAQLLKRDIVAIGSFQVKMWMVLILILVLIFAIILTLILNRPRNTEQTEPFPETEQKKKEKTPNKGTQETAREKVNEPEEDSSSMMTMPIRPHRQAADDDDMPSTLPIGASISVTFEIYENNGPRKETSLITGEKFLIGRAKECNLRTDPKDLTVSGKHLILFSRKSALYLQDISTYKATKVNGHAIEEPNGNEDDTDSGTTRPIGKSAASSAAAPGFKLNSGDEISLGETCRIRVIW